MNSKTPIFSIAQDKDRVKVVPILFVAVMINLKEGNMKMVVLSHEVSNGLEQAYLTFMVVTNEQSSVQGTCPRRLETHVRKMWYLLGYQKGCLQNEKRDPYTKPKLEIKLSVILPCQIMPLKMRKSRRQYRKSRNVLDPI